jgi:hypothetical protein
MTVWQRAEDFLNAIQRDLNQDPSNWEGAMRGTDNVQLLVPGVPRFQKYEPGQALQMVDWRIVELGTGLDHLKASLTTQDREMALGAVMSALENVRALGLKEV